MVTLIATGIGLVLLLIVLVLMVNPPSAWINPGPAQPPSKQG